MTRKECEAADPSGADASMRNSEKLRSGFPAIYCSMREAMSATVAEPL